MFQNIFVIVMIYLFLPTLSQATEVVYVGSSFVIIDAGKEQGLTKGDTVCIGTTSQNCSSIHVVRQRLSGIKIQTKSPIKAGTKVTGPKLMEQKGTKASQSEIDALVAAIEKTEEKDSSDKTKAHPSSTQGSAAVQKQNPFGFSLGFLYTPLLPYEHRVPRYEIDNQLLRSGPLWASDLKVQSAKTGLQGSIFRWIQPLWLINATVKYRMPFKDTLDIDYDPVDPSVYARVTTRTSSYGMILSAAHKSLSLPWLDLRTSGGLDFDRSNVAVQITSEGAEENTRIASQTSMLTVISLRIGAIGSYPMAKIRSGLEIQLHALFPLHAIAQVHRSRQNLRPEVNNTQRERAPQDFETAISHQRTKIGLELSVNATYQ